LWGWADSRIWADLREITVGVYISVSYMEI